MLKLLLLIFFFVSCSEQEREKTTSKEEERKNVKVAALQYYSRMGDKDYNWKLSSKLITSASENGAVIVVLPEAAITGYMDPAEEITWTSGSPSAGEISIQNNAETVDGDFIKKYMKLADELNIYLTIPFVEKAKEKFYNSVILCSPKGELLIHHRKKSLWTHGDSGWCEEGGLPPKVVETEYGRLGVMICYDVHSMPKILADLKADIVLYSVGWYGPNTEDWYKVRFPNKHVIPNNFSVVAANWSHEKGKKGWPGCGWSNVTYRNGVVLNITSKIAGEDIVYAKIPLN